MESFMGHVSPPIFICKKKKFWWSKHIHPKNNLSTFFFIIFLTMIRLITFIDKCLPSLILMFKFHLIYIYISWITTKQLLQKIYSNCFFQYPCNANIHKSSLTLDPSQQPIFSKMCPSNRQNQQLSSKIENVSLLPKHWIKNNYNILWSCCPYFQINW